jgi:hypothetical protein
MTATISSTAGGSAGRCAAAGGPLADLARARCSVLEDPGSMATGLATEERGVSSQRDRTRERLSATGRWGAS